MTQKIDAETAATLLSSLLSGSTESAAILLDTIINTNFSLKDEVTTSIYVDGEVEGSIDKSYAIEVTIDAEDIESADEINEFVISVARKLLVLKRWCTISIVRIEVRAYRFWCIESDSVPEIGNR